MLDRLPAVRGTYTENAPLAGLTWFRVGGPARVLFQPADAADLAEFRAKCPADVPVTVIGVGSNLLVRDGGIEGVVIRLGRGFNHIIAEGETVRAGAAALDMAVARGAQEAGLSGLEFLRGIPGTIGGALRMNAGSYGGEIKSILLEAEAIDSQGRMRRYSVEDMQLSYRTCGLPRDLLFIEALFRGLPADRDAIAGRMAEITASREATQPVKSRTGGSTFKNPPAEISGGRKAWQLVDAAGCRGLKIGAARVSEQHCNFLINEGGASAADIETLGEEVRRRVRETTGVTLEWEIIRLGEAAAVTEGRA